MERRRPQERDRRVQVSKIFAEAASLVGLTEGDHGAPRNELPFADSEGNER